jgi:hypothetical protein
MAPGAYAQTPPANWHSDLRRYLGSLFACAPDSPGDDSPCNRFVGFALANAYCVKDFGPNASGGYLVANEIMSRIGTTTGWTLLGKLPVVQDENRNVTISPSDAAKAQQILDAAQQRANAGDAVVAGTQDADEGHLSLIIDGHTNGSGQWNPLLPPNSANMKHRFPADPNKSYIDKPLSYAFADPDDVLIYAKQRPTSCAVPEP